MALIRLVLASRVTDWAGLQGPVLVGKERASVRACCCFRAKEGGRPENKKEHKKRKVKARSWNDDDETHENRKMPLKMTDRLDVLYLLRIRLFFWSSSFPRCRVELTKWRTHVHFRFLLRTSDSFNQRLNWLLPQRWLPADLMISAHPNFAAPELGSERVT